VQSTLRVPPSRRGVQRGNNLIKGMRHRDWLPFRTCLLQMLLRPFIFSRTFAICSFRPVLFFPSCFRTILSLASAAISTMSPLSHPRHFQQQEQLDLVRHLLGWTVLELARKIRAGLSSLDDVVAREFILFNLYITCGLAPPISSFFFLLLEEFRLQLQYLTPHSIPLVSVFIHFMEMFVGVRPCVTIFKHFYALDESGRSRCAIGAYYFQLRHGMSSSYISTFSSAKWEDWRTDWVIAMTDANDRLELPTGGPFLDRNSWRAKPSLPAELDPELDRVKVLARGGLTSMMVLGEFLRHRIAPLQQRSRMACMFTGVNDCSRI
jgi:hypothetical protein